MVVDVRKRMYELDELKRLLEENTIEVSDEEFYKEHGWSYIQYCMGKWQNLIDLAVSTRIKLEVCKFVCNCNLDSCFQLKNNCDYLNRLIVGD